MVPADVHRYKDSLTRFECVLLVEFPPDYRCRTERVIYKEKENELQHVIQFVFYVRSIYIFLITSASRNCSFGIFETVFISEFNYFLHFK